MEAIITLKNYRCFADSKPLVVKLKPGFISLVGQNNSGKSSFLKFFYEFRELWSNLTKISTIASISNPNTKKNYSIKGSTDPNEIFTNTNDRQLSICIEITSIKTKNSRYLSKLKCLCDPNSPNDFHFLMHDNQRKRIISAQNLGDKALIIAHETIDCSDFIETVQALTNSIYIGAFRNAINQGSGNYYDLAIGTSFISTWNSWKTGTKKQNNKKIQQVTEDIRKIFNFESLEINASEDVKTLQVIINKKPYELRELGDGIAQFIIVFGNVAIKNPAYILIDEPELNLHPSLQIDFLTSLASYASIGIIFATHSIGLARATSEQIYSFQKEEEENSMVKTFEESLNYTEFLGEMSYSSYTSMGFNKILLVEGITDVRTFQQFLRKK